MTDKPTPPSKKQWMIWASLLVVVYLGIHLVGWNRTLIPDEIRALLLADAPLSEHLAYAKQDMIHPPLPYLLARGWLDVFGHTDAAAKASALLIGILTIILFTYLASRVTRYGWLLSLLFCAPYFRIGSSVNLVRMYGLLLLLFVIALLLWDAWRKNPSTGRLVGWVVVLTLMVYTHGSALLMLPGFVVVNWLYGSRKWAFTIATALPALALLPWVLIVLPSYSSGFFDDTLGWAYDNPTHILLQLPFFFFSGEESGGGALWPPLHLVSFRRWLVVGALLVNGALLVFAWQALRRIGLPKRDDDDTARWFWTALILCALPTLVLYVFSLLFLPVLHARYLLVTLPMYWMLIVLLGQMGGRPGRALVGVVALWTLVSAGLTFQQNIPPSLPRAGTDHIVAAKQEGDLVVVTEHMPLGFQVYWEWTRRLNRTDPIVVLWTDMVTRTQDIVPGTRLEDLELEGVDRIWLFYERNRDMKPVAEYLTEKHFRQEDVPALSASNLAVLIEQSNLNVFIKTDLEPPPAASATAE